MTHMSRSKTGHDQSVESELLDYTLKTNVPYRPLRVPVMCGAIAYVGSAL